MSEPSWLVSQWWIHQLRTKHSTQETFRGTPHIQTITETKCYLGHDSSAGWKAEPRHKGPVCVHVAYSHHYSAPSLEGAKEAKRGLTHEEPPPGLSLFKICCDSLPTAPSVLRAEAQTEAVSFFKPSVFHFILKNSQIHFFDHQGFAWFGFCFIQAYLLLLPTPFGHSGPPFVLPMTLECLCFQVLFFLCLQIFVWQAPFSLSDLRKNVTASKIFLPSLKFS
jgi:hypothetical protein